MTILLTTEDGKILTTESVPGITGASSLNDISIQPIYKETFDTDPSTRGWIIGSDWEWDSVNKRMKNI